MVIWKILHSIILFIVAIPQYLSILYNFMKWNNIILSINHLQNIYMYIYNQLIICLTLSTIYIFFPYQLVYHFISTQLNKILFKKHVVWLLPTFYINKFEFKYNSNFINAIETFTFQRLSVYYAANLNTTFESVWNTFPSV